MSGEPPRCSVCGVLCADGFEYREREAERETGYRDQEYVCELCLEEEGRFDAADMAFDLQNEGE